MHVDWAAGAPIPGVTVTADEARTMDLTPKTITAFLVGLDTKIAIFGVQRRINEYREEPLLAIIPGVALQELWDLMSVAENVLRVVSSMVVVTGLLGMLDRHPVQPRSEAARDGGAPIRGRAAPARLRAVHE